MVHDITLPGKSHAKFQHAHTTGFIANVGIFFRYRRSECTGTRSKLQTSSRAPCVMYSLRTETPLVLRARSPQALDGPRQVAALLRCKPDQFSGYFTARSSKHHLNGCFKGTAGTQEHFSRILLTRMAPTQQGTPHSGPPLNCADHV